MKKSVGKVYNALQKKRKSIKKRSIFLILFLFGINAYAWFVYMSNANLSVSANVTTWDVSFYDGNESVKDLNINTGDLYPGMADFTKELKIKNNSNVAADFSFEIDRLNILGMESNPGIENTASVISMLEGLPFKTTFNNNKDELEKKDIITFLLKVTWPYEAENNYYKLNSYYTYDESFSYYTYDGSNYTIDSSVNSLNYSSKVENGLYIESDDADSYWGEKCSAYKESSGNNYCYSFHLKLKVIQKAE